MKVELLERFAYSVIRFATREGKVGQTAAAQRMLSSPIRNGEELTRNEQKL